MCRRGAEQKHRHFVTIDSRVAAGTYLWAHNQILEKVDILEYLGQMLSLYDSDWPAIVSNLHRAQSNWGRFYLLWGWEGSDTSTSCKLCVLVVLFVLIFRSYLWAIIPHILRALGSLHNQVERHIYVQMYQFQNGQWEYLPICEALVGAVLGAIG